MAVLASRVQMHENTLQVMTAPTAPLALTDRLAAWRYAFLTTNPPEQGIVDGVTRWLVVTRAGVLPMTLTSG